MEVLDIRLFGQEPRWFDEVAEGAVANADLTKDHVTIFGCPGVASSGGYRAMFWERHQRIEEGETDMDLGERLADANAPDCLFSIRIAVCVDYPEEVVSGLVRHELEHARQSEVIRGNLASLFMRGLDVLEPARGVQNEGLLYGSIPLELDANAAAALYVRSRYGEDQIDALVRTEPGYRLLLGPPASLPDLATVEDRMRRFIRTDGPRLVSGTVAAGEA